MAKCDKLFYRSQSAALMDSVTAKRAQRPALDHD